MMSERGKTGHRKDSADWDSEGEPIAKTSQNVRKKGLPRYAPNANPGPGIDLDYAPFSAASVEALISNVGYPVVKGLTGEEVKESLNLQARNYKLRVELDRQPTIRMLIDELKGLERSARDLEARLPLVNVPGDPDGLEFAAAPAQGLLSPLRHVLPEAMAIRVAQHRKERSRSVHRGGILIKEEDTSSTEETLFGATTAADLLTILSKGAGVLAAACSAAARDAEDRTQPENGPVETATALKKTVHDLLQLYANFFGRKATISKDGITGRPMGPALRFIQSTLQVLGVETSDDNLLRIYRQRQETAKEYDASAG